MFEEFGDAFGYLRLCLTRGQMMEVMGKVSAASRTDAIPCRIYSMF